MKNERQEDFVFVGERLRIGQLRQGMGHESSWGLGLYIMGMVPNLGLIRHRLWLLMHYCKPALLACRYFVVSHHAFGFVLYAAAAAAATALLQPLVGTWLGRSQTSEKDKKKLCFSWYYKPWGTRTPKILFILISKTYFLFI